jgi:pentatricopeptide repeat protein
MFAKLKRPGDAIHWLEVMNEFKIRPHVSTYTTLIGMYAKLKDPTTAMRWYSKMIAEGKGFFPLFSFSVLVLVLVFGFSFGEMLFCLYVCMFVCVFSTIVQTN